MEKRISPGSYQGATTDFEAFPADTALKAVSEKIRRQFT